MISYLPELYPDELVYSWFCRYYVHSGCLTNKMALDDILLKKCHNPSKEFIGHLNPLSHKKIQEVISMEDLVLNHTMFPQYARFLPPEEKKKAMYHLAYDFCDPHHLFAILPRTEGDMNLKYCPLCVREDRQLYGETYWHRKHQIWNMQTCYKHKCMLESSNVSAKSEQCYTFYSAEQYVKETTPKPVDSELQKFSEFMAKIFDSPIEFENNIPISAILHYGLVGTKYMSKKGTTKYTRKLSEDLYAYYTNLRINDIASMSQIQRHWFGARFDFSVVCQIAFLTGISIEDITLPSLTEKQVKNVQNTHYMTGKQPIDWNVLDKEIATRLESFAKSIYDGSASEVGRPERVSGKLVCRHFELEKHRLDNMPLCHEIMQRYYESYPECWARKIIWAYHKLESENKTFFWSDIRRLSGVKKDNIEKVIPYLYKHTTKEISNKIINLCL